MHLQHGNRKAGARQGDAPDCLRECPAQELLGPTQPNACCGYMCYSLQAGEGDEVGGQLAEVSVQLAGEAQAAGHACSSAIVSLQGKRNTPRLP